MFKKLLKFTLFTTVLFSILAFTPPTTSYDTTSGIDTYTKLLLPGDGSDTATFIPDTSNVNDYVGTTNKNVLTLHLDGADAATATTDAATNKAVTFVGTAQLDTAQSKFGGSSLLLDGNSYWV